jgi:hypothetical protein
VIRQFDEPPQRVRPRGHPPALVEVETERPADALCRLDDVGSDGSSAGESERPFPEGACKLAIPLLPLLTEMDRVEQVGARPLDTGASNRAKVGNGHTLDGRLREKETRGGDEGGTAFCATALIS